MTNYFFILYIVYSILNIHVHRKKFNNDGNQKLAVQANFSFDFGLVSAAVLRFLPLCIVFGPLTTTTSCQDTDFFLGMIYICIYAPASTNLKICKIC